MLELSRTDARRIAVRAQLLDLPRPADMFEVIRHLTLLQWDQTTAVAPSHELVLWSRLGNRFRPEQLSDALAEQRLIDLRLMIRPAEDIALYRADMLDWERRTDLKEWELGVRDWVFANDACRRDLIERLRRDGPLAARELPDTCDVPWRSSGWNNNRNVQQLLECMVVRGDVAAAGRDGRDRLWDLAERVYPDDDPVPSARAATIRNERRLQAYGIVRARAAAAPVEPNDVGEVGEPAVVAGVPGEWRVDPSYLDRPFRGRAALLSPIDRLVFDRKRMEELFQFDYQLEMYKPAATRKWGYWALPILYGDRLVGKLDATADRKAGVFEVHAIHRDVEFSRAMTAAVDREIADLAEWLHLPLVLPD